MKAPGVALEVLPAATFGAVKPPIARRIRLQTLDQISVEMAKLYREARAGEIALGDATRLAYLLSVLAKMRESGDLARRVEQLEAEIDR
jgi:hypothetical protein